MTEQHAEIDPDDDEAVARLMAGARTLCTRKCSPGNEDPACPVHTTWQSTSPGQADPS